MPSRVIGVFDARAVSRCIFGGFALVFNGRVVCYGVVFGARGLGGFWGWEWEFEQFFGGWQRDVDGVEGVEGGWWGGRINIFGEGGGGGSRAG